MKKGIALFLALLLCAAVGCTAKPAIEAPELLEPVGVKYDTAKVVRGSISDTTVYTGEVIPEVEEVHFVVNGKLKEVSVQVGDTVKKGQVLASLDSKALEERIDNLESEITHQKKLRSFDDRSLRKDIAIKEEELEILKQTGASAEMITVKEIEIDQVWSALSQSNELWDLSIENSSRALETAQNEYSKTKIVAPISGQVVYVTPTHLGQVIGAYTPAVCIADESSLYIVSDYVAAADVSAASAVYAKIGDRTYEVAYQPYEDSVYVSLLLSGAEMESMFLFSEPDEAIKSGQYAAVYVVSFQEDGVLTIPANALHRDELGHYVYRIEDGVRVRRDVEIGQETDVLAEIVEGLQEGDEVYVKN